MIVTEFYKGQGLGNQLWCYVTTRVIAKDKGYDFGIQHPEIFKGNDFFRLDFGKQVIGGTTIPGGPALSLPQGIFHYYKEGSLTHPDGSDIRIGDEKLLNVPDNTKIDGHMQDGHYIAHRKEEIKEWLKVKEEYEFFDFSSDDICIINFRGGSYIRDKNFFLPKEYWERSIAQMRSINKNFKFIVISDDVKTAKKFFPDFKVYHFSIAKDYVIIKNAHYLILSNSSFAWFPAWLSEKLKYCIAPKYWARHNTSDGYWSLGYNITEGWIYLDRKGILTDYDTCLKERDAYMEKHASSFVIDSPFDATKPFVPLPAPIIKVNHSLRTKLAMCKKRVENKIRWEFKKLFRSTFMQRVLETITEYKIKKAWLSPQEIDAYRKKIKVYDVFHFFNELDLLEIRLQILDSSVDYFVISEATETFSGIKKPLYYKENKERFKKWEHKIIHQVIDDIPKDRDDLRSRLHSLETSDVDRQVILHALTSSTVGAELVWLKEFYIKESVKKALVDLHDNDICFISDLDEIWNPELKIDYSKDDIFKPRQVAYMYFLNNRSNENWLGWTGTIVTKYKNIKNVCLGNLRTDALTSYTVLKNGGWHFTFQGGFEGAMRKIKESDHPFYKPTETLPNLKDMVLQNKDYQGRKINFKIDERNLPTYLLENKDKYKQFFK